MHAHTNHLIEETSPYLLQHAHNPVDWYPWSETALEKAKQENKPILVSIGYAACHWCHVMERESFENEETASIMNEHFINIKIDREERPDLDHIYMDAVQAMTGSGGWPLNVFLTPSAKPFYGGTYFPPVRAFNRPSWQEVLLGVSRSFREKREEIEMQAENLTGHLLQSNSFGMQTSSDDELFTAASLDETCRNVLKNADTEWGGFGKAPKFPQTFAIQFLLRYFYSNHVLNTGLDKTPEETGKKALDQALLSLDKMIEGGIYDQAGGGFSRYSTDTEWLAPHFEKMLYDNALLVSVISEAYQLTGKHRYREVIMETMDFIQREMMHPEYGFYAALDADSEGVEGKFYVWEYEEVKTILEKEAELFCEYFDISKKGNWSDEHVQEKKGENAGGKNILRVKESPEKFASRKQMDVARLVQVIGSGKKKLMEARSKRIRPALDDKIILGWNALMNTATSKAFAATGMEEYRQLAIKNMTFLIANFTKEIANNTNGIANEANKPAIEYYHTWKNGQGKYPAFIDDYAYLIQALLHLQEITSDTSWLTKANEITNHVITNFSEAGTGFFFYTREGQKDIIVRKKEVYDGAIPSGNSVMAYNLYQLSVLFDKKEWRARAEQMITSLGKAIIRYPGSFGVWATLLNEVVGGTSEIVVLGDGSRELGDAVMKEYIPQKVFMTAENSLPGYPLLAGKERGNKPSIWLCRNYTCKLPVFSVSELISLINRSPGP
jgi:uncharacterized protein YyaL (SSP411 family)